MAIETINFRPIELYGEIDPSTPLIINGLDAVDGVSNAAKLHDQFREGLADDYELYHPLFGLYWPESHHRYFLGSYTDPVSLEKALGQPVKSERVPGGRYARDGIWKWQEKLEQNGPDRLASFIASISLGLEKEASSVGFRMDTSRPEIEIYHNRVLGNLTLLLPIK